MTQYVYTQKVAVTDSDSSHTDFNPVVKVVKIKNAGNNACYFNLNAAATTSHFKLDPTDEITIGLADITDVHAICDAGLTTTLYIIGWESYW